MKKLLAFVRSPAARWAFLGVAFALAVYAVVSNWDQLVEAATQLAPSTIMWASVASIAYVFLTLMSWKTVLSDLGSDLDIGPATAVFGLSQVGKYMPGGVWNIVAAAELGADHDIPRRRSVAAMAVTVLISIVTGSALGAMAFALAPAGALSGWSYVAWAAPVFMVLLFPPILNRCIDLAFRLLNRPALEQRLSGRGTVAAVLWAVLAWVVVGIQVWVVALDLGMSLDLRTLSLAIGGYALAWVIGFLIFFVPAGAGAREAVLIAILAGTLPSAAILLLVIVSRVLLTVVDFLFAGMSLVLIRRMKRKKNQSTLI